MPFKHVLHKLLQRPPQGTCDWCDDVMIIVIHDELGGGNSNIFWNFHLYLGKTNPI